MDTEIGYKFLDDDWEVVIMDDSFEDAEKVIKKLNEEHHNGYKYLGTIVVYKS